MIDLSKETNKKPINTKEKALKDSKKFITTKLGIIGVAVVSVVWLFWGFFTPAFRETPIWIILLSSAVSMLVAYSIGALLRYQGILSGSADSEVVELKNEHRKVVVEANEYAEWSDEWSDEENRIALKLARTHILMSAGLKYTEFFDEDGNYTGKEIDAIEKDAPKWKRERYDDKNKKLSDAISFKVTPVTMPAVSAESHVDLDYNNTGLSPEEHLRISNIKAAWQKVATVAVFGMIGLQLNGISAWESLFNGLAQLVVFLLFGLVGFYSEYTYMTNNYTSNLRKKINLLKRLITFGKKQSELEKIKKQEVKNDGIEERRPSEQSEEISRTDENIQSTTGTSIIQQRATFPTRTTQTATNEHATKQGTIGRTIIPR